MLKGVPIDVLAERLGCNRNALYKLLHDARRNLRAHLAEAGPGGERMTGRDLGPTLKRLLGPNEPEIGCDECFAQLDRYVELELAGAHADESCPACAPTLPAVPPAPRSTRACAHCSSSMPCPERAEMQTTKYLIVGGGMTGDVAAKGIREHDADGSITLVGAEPHPPYERPLLKKLWRGAPRRRSGATRPTASSCARPPHRLARPRGAHGDRRRRRGVRVGEAPARHRRQPREIPGADGVVYFRTLDDYRRLREPRRRARTSW